MTFHASLQRSRESVMVDLDSVLINTLSILFTTTAFTVQQFSACRSVITRTNYSFFEIKRDTTGVMDFAFALPSFCFHSAFLLLSFFLPSAVILPSFCCHSFFLLLSFFLPSAVILSSIPSPDSFFFIVFSFFPHPFSPSPFVSLVCLICCCCCCC